MTDRTFGEWGRHDALQWGETSTGLLLPIRVDTSGQLSLGSLASILFPRSDAVITLANRSTTGSTASLDVSSYGTAVLNVSANAGSTVQFEGSVDGSTWFAIKGHQRGAGVFSSTTSSTGVWAFDVRAFSLFRANITVAAGAVTATAYGSAAPGVAYLMDVEGNIASGSTDSGNPLKTGGKYNAANITVTDGQRVDTQASVNGFTRTDMGTALAGEDLTYNRLKTMPVYTYSPVTASDQQVKASAGVLHSVTISCNDAAPTAGSIIIYDNTAESGTQVFNHTFTTTPFVPFTVVLDYDMLTGIYIGFTTTGDVNVSCAFK